MDDHSVAWRTVRTERLVGRDFQEGDFEDYARLFADEQVTATLGGPLARDRARGYFDAGLAHWRAHDFGLWTFRDHQGGFVGRGGLRHCVATGRAELELAYALDAAHWGRGLAVEIARASAKLAFGVLGLDAIVAFTLTGNLRSQRVLAKAGFVHERDGERDGEPHYFYRLSAAAAREQLFIRPVGAHDVEGAVVVVRETLAEFGLAFGVGSETDEQVRGLPGSYENSGGRFWVAVDGAGTVVGTAGVFPLAPGVWELRKMYLRPATRGHGVGARLFDTCLAFCRERGARRLVLDTREDMTQAIAFYQRRGFVRDDAQCRGARCDRGYRLDL